MKKFKFRLQPVLDMKEKILKDKLLELSNVLRTYQEEIGRLKELQDNQEKTEQTLFDLCNNTKELNIAEMQLHKNFLSQMMLNIKKQENIIDNVSKLVKQKQIEANNALKEKEIYEKLKENAKNDFYKEMIRIENVEADDVTLSRYAQRAINKNY